MGRSSPTRGPGSASPSNWRAGRKRGYAYIAITDHSNRVTTARGLDARRLRQQWRAIDKLAEKVKGITILKGRSRI